MSELFPKTHGIRRSRSKGSVEYLVYAAYCNPSNRWSHDRRQALPMPQSQAEHMAPHLLGEAFALHAPEAAE